MIYITEIKRVTEGTSEVIPVRYPRITPTKTILDALDKARSWLAARRYVTQGTYLIQVFSANESDYSKGIAKVMEERFIVPPSFTQVHSPYTARSTYSIVRAPASGLIDAMMEELTAGDWYRRRAAYYSGIGMNEVARLFMHIATEEDGHYREFSEMYQKAVADRLGYTS